MRRVAVVLIAIMFAVIGCANDNDTDAAASPDSSPAATSGPVTALQGKVSNHGQKNFTTENVKLTLEADNNGSDYYFKPTFIVAPGGSTAKIELKNEGDVEHNLTIPVLKVDEDVEAGKSKNLTLELGTDSFVTFFCKYHRLAGMQGAFRLH